MSDLFLQSLDHFVDLGIFTFDDRFFDAFVNMGFEDLVVGLLEDRPGGHQLIGDVQTVAIFRDHLEDAVDLALGDIEILDDLTAVFRHFECLPLRSRRRRSPV